MQKPDLMLTASEHKRFWTKVDKTQSCWIWTAAKMNKWGHGAFRLDRNRKRRVALAHRVSFVNAGGTFTEEHQHCLHRCDNPSCVNPEHLYAGNDLLNVRDMHDRGRQRISGESHPNAKLNEVKVAEIRELYKLGKLSLSKIAKLYRVSRGAIQGITDGTNWSHSV